MSDVTALQNEVAQLRDMVATMDRSAQMLIRRDRELHKAHEQLREIDAVKSEFISIAAHQMRTPLSAIKWSHQMLINEELGPLTSDQRKILQQSLHSVYRMVRLVNNLLDADHLDIGATHLELRDVDIVKLISEVIESQRAAADDKHLIVEFTHYQTLPRIQLNADRMKDAIGNLLDNAIKYTPAEGTISISIRPVESFVVIEISDTGIGIPEDHKPRMFTRFARADNAKRVDADGSGLGLYIVKKIIQNHSGSITYTSVEGEGTVFTVSLPVAAVTS